MGNTTDDLGNLEPGTFFYPIGGGSAHYDEIKPIFMLAYIGRDDCKVIRMKNMDEEMVSIRYTVAPIENPPESWKIKMVHYLV